MTGRDVRNWLTWPVNQFEILPNGVLLFACRASNWQRQQLLQAVLLAVAQVPNVRLVLHGVSLPASGVGGMTGGVISNGPLLQGSTIVFVESRLEMTETITARFFDNDPVMVENLLLLRKGEGAIVTETGTIFTFWRTQI